MTAKLRRRLQKLFFAEQWSILVCGLDGVPVRQIIPPIDRSWADPFPVEHQGRYYVFLEQQIHGRNGTLGYIELFGDLSYSEFKPILERDYHLSYPNVFRQETTDGPVWYMIPETNENGSIDLYRATAFPDGWIHDSTLISGIRAVDPTLFKSGNAWYLFVSCSTDSTRFNDSLFIFKSDRFPSVDWVPHRNNPVKRDAGSSRMAGGIFVETDGTAIRPGQDCVKEYGHKTVLSRIATLDGEKYEEETVRTVLPDRAYGAVCTHTWNRCGKYVLRDIKTRKLRLFR